MGCPRENLVPIGFWQRLFAPLFDFREHLLTFSTHTHLADRHRRKAERTWSCHP